MRRSVKQFAKRGLQHIAARLGPQTRGSGMPQLVILMYHRILPTNDNRALIEEPGMIVTPESLALHIGILKNLFEVVKLSEWIERKYNGGTLPEKACAITFDDGWSDNYEFAFPVLQAYAIPATIFLVSDMVGTKDAFWPERLAQLLTTLAVKRLGKLACPAMDMLGEMCGNSKIPEIPPSPDELSHIISRVKRLSDDDINNRLDKIAQELGLTFNDQSSSLLNWKQLSIMTDSGLVEAGSHTRRHIRLDMHTPAATLRSEIIESKRIIENNTGIPVKTFCFPNGDYSPQALDLVRAHYTAAVTTSSGWNSMNTDDHLLYRIGVHEDIASDKTAFLARLSGWI